MKKTYLYLVTLILLNSCIKKNEITINEFNKSLTMEYPIDSNHQYTEYVFKLKGIVDDTIIINKKHYFCGRIDTIIRNDFYGGDNYIQLNFEPFRAKKGVLKIVQYAN